MKKTGKWLTRFLRVFRQDRSDDTITAEVGGNARNVIVGKNVIQIGTLVISIPSWLVYLIAFSVASYLFWMIVQFGSAFLPPGPMPEGHFNIAVAEWSIKDKDGNPVTQRKTRHDAKQIVGEIADYLDDQKNTFKPNSLLTPNIEGPNERSIPAVSTDDEAAQLASELRATLLVYGEVKILTPHYWEYTPKFYVNVEAFKRSKELVGSYALGKPIDLDVDNIFGMSHINTTLSNRLNVLLTLTAGISYIVQDHPNYNAAINTLEKLKSGEGWPSEVDGGQEVLHHFLGNAYLGKAQETLEIEPKNELFLRSRDAYSKAVSLNANYPRSYNGLGSVYYDLAMLEVPCSSETLMLLQKSNEQYIQALKLDSNQKPYHAFVNDFAFAERAAVETQLGNCAIGSNEALYYSYRCRHWAMCVEAYSNVWSNNGSMYRQLSRI
ncbi:MAG: hypothetical protein H6641_11230 [Caldilineaceae bacterium]|nr:hypothetical protein [Caldilineaceae bacterium]